MAPTTVDTTAYNYISAGNTKHRYFVDRQFALLEKHKCLRWLDPEEEMPNLFCHPIFVVEKTGSDKLRLIMDFRKLNELVETESFSLRTLAKAREMLATAAGFGCIVLTLTLTWFFSISNKSNRDYTSVHTCRTITD